MEADSVTYTGVFGLIPSGVAKGEGAAPPNYKKVRVRKASNLQ